MKNLPLFSFSILASIVVLSACAQTSVSVRPVVSNNEKTDTKPAASAQRQYTPISRNEPYIVQTGDTLYGISFRAGLSYREVAAWNNISEPYTVKVGQRLVLQAGSNPVLAAAPSTHGKSDENRPMDTSPAVVKTPVVKAPMPEAVSPVAADTPISKPAPPTIPVTGNVEKPVPLVDRKPVENSAAISWRWPSEGTVIARYVQGDTSQQGINIGGKSGQPIHASGDGTVVYSGAGLVGYGELIIIKHNNEWLSAYAHNRRRLVSEGTKVKAGDVIAEMGRTGTLRDMLHFEIRRNGKPVDPLV